MKHVLSILITGFLLIPLVFTTGCATMNQSECQVANWEIIGLEDASAGRSSSYIGQHRSACAEYGLSPDLELYMKGYERGLARFCTYQNGLNLGSNGRSYASICSGDSAEDFMRGYSQGRQDFEMRQNINRLKSEISRHHQRLQQIEIQIDKKEDLIVSANTSSESRRQLLAEIESLREEKQVIELELPEFERELFQLEDEYARRNQ